MQMEEKLNAPLAGLTTFGVKQSAERMVVVRSAEDLLAFFETAKSSSQPLRVLGGGSNVLLRGDLEGTTLLMRIKGIEVLEEVADSHVVVRVGAGENWHGFVMHCVHNGYQGIENLALIPGTVGASPIQNIGAYGVEVESVIERVECIDFEGNAISLTREECLFGYRDSVFKQSLSGRVIITRVVFRLSLSKRYAIKTQYGDVLTELEAMQRENPDVQDVAEAVSRIRRRKLPDWRDLGNAGSFFKNPIVPLEVGERLLSDNPVMPNWTANTEEGEPGMKLSAAWLIEQAGLKGFRLGAAGVYAKHALVLVNHGGATGGEVWAVAQHVMAEVEAKFGLRLTPEVNQWGGAIAK